MCSARFLFAFLKSEFVDSLRTLCARETPRGNAPREISRQPRLGASARSSIIDLRIPLSPPCDRTRLIGSSGHLGPRSGYKVDFRAGTNFTVSRPSFRVRIDSIRPGGRPAGRSAEFHFQSGPHLDFYEHHDIRQEHGICTAVITAVFSRASLARARLPPPPLVRAPRRRL